MFRPLTAKSVPIIQGCELSILYGSQNDFEAPPLPHLHRVSPFFADSLFGEVPHFHRTLEHMVSYLKLALLPGLLPGGSGWLINLLTTRRSGCSPLWTQFPCICKMWRLLACLLVLLWRLLINWLPSGIGYETAVLQLPAIVDTTNTIVGQRISHHLGTVQQMEGVLSTFNLLLHLPFWARGLFPFPMFLVQSWICSVCAGRRMRPPLTKPRMALGVAGCQLDHK